MQPLSGIRVLDVTSVIMGPFAAQMLGDMGADVIKIEPPGGDSVRAVGPARHPGMGPMFMQANRNKRSLVLDLKHTAGREALLRLARTADVMLYNVRPQAMARLRLADADVRAVNPEIIHVGAFGFGQTGPYAARPAFDDLVQGLLALPSLFVQAGGDIPRYAPLAVIDRYMASAVCNAILGALLYKQRTGRGQAIEVPMFETMVQIILGDHMGGMNFEPPLGPPGYPRSLAPERHPYKTRDGYVCVMVFTDRHWASFCALVGDPDRVRTDPRFAGITQRTEHARAVHAYLEEKLTARTTAEWLAAFIEADIPATPLHTLTSLFDDEHVVKTGLIQIVEHPSEGAVRVVMPAATWSLSPPDIRRLPPRLGEHSAELLREAGYGDADIRGLVEAGVTTLG
ncbi:MAG: CoA transferase [Betaproteobacteria bacterium]